MLVPILQHCFWQITRELLLVSLWNLFSLVCNFIMNRLTNEQRLQIIEFYYQNAYSFIHFFIEKFCSATKLISGWMATSTSKIAAYGMKTARSIASATNASRQSHFGVDYGPVASSGRTSSNVTMAGTLLWMACDGWLTIFVLPKMEELDMPDMWLQQDGATCHAKQWPNWEPPSVDSLFHAPSPLIGHLDRVI